MVVLESASAGLPVIASKIKGITTAFNFSDGENILYTQPENTDELRKKIEYLLKNEETAKLIGKKASVFVKSNYTTRQLAKNLAGFVESI